eukprot:TRINITY_DN1533_c0_g1_i2.p1 TRINITY_DN1533_c0_g1~~TRINITY_DN1533_c0_g1_i2.p1  ORF type:complete len:503 (+),score=97.76 TRINITY_DN1533_c0_g1_i2:367-1875(+)
MNVLRMEGPVGLYRGLLPQLLGQTPEKAIRLFLVDKIRNLSSTKDVSLTMEVVAGLIAGANQVIITNPTEIIKVRLQTQGDRIINQKRHIEALRMKGLPVTEEILKPKGIIQMMKDLGFKGLYKGSSACFLRDIPFSGICFPAYALLKELFRQDNKPLSILHLFACSSIAGMAASSLTTPADVIKTRMQIESKRGEGYSSFRDCVKQMAKQEGFKAFWKGLVPRVARSSPQYGVMLLSYELLQNWLTSEETVHTLTGSNKQSWVKVLLLEDKMGLLLESRWDPPESFAQFEGGFKHISVGGQKQVWALSKDERVFRWADSAWKQTAGKLKQLSSGQDGTVWGVGRDGVVFRWNGNTFEVMPGELNHIAVGSAKNICALTQKGNVVQWNGNDWDSLYSEESVVLKTISCGADGTLWGVGHNSTIFRFNHSIGSWQVMPGTMKQVSVGSAYHVWGVDKNDSIYRWDRNGVWLKLKEQVVAHTEQHISVGSDGSVVSASVNDEQL